MPNVKVKQIVVYFLNNFQQLNIYIKVFVILSLVFGTLIRIFNLFNLGFIFDMVTTQYAWGKAGWEMGYFGFWKDYNGFFDYWPVTLLIEIIIYGLSLPFGGTAQNFVTIAKLFNWSVEIIFCMVLFYISIDRDKTSFSKEEEKQAPLDKCDRAYINACLAYILPSLWFVSGVWGQNDTLVAFLTFSVICLLYKNRDSIHVADRLPVFYKDSMFWTGVFLAFTFWIKQQAILILPVLIVYHLYQKSWKNILNFIIWLTPFIVSFIYGAILYANGKWELTAIIGGCILLAGTLVMFIFINKNDNWVNVRRQAFGFLTTTSIILIPLLFLNYQRVGSTTFSVFGRTDNVANGGATFWGLIDVNGFGSDYLLKIFSGGISVNLAGYLIYLMLMTTLLWKLFDLDIKKVRTMNLQNIFSKQITLRQFILLMFLNTTSYFLFFTKMHSRYLHFGIIFGLLSLAFLTSSKQWKSWLILTTVFSFGYFLNQIAMYSIAIFGLSSDQPRWVYDLLAMFGFSPWKLSSLITLISLFYFYQILLVIVKENSSKLKILDNI